MIPKKITKDFRRFRIKKRIRKVISGTAERPRLSVFRSNKEIYAQLIDDVTSTTIISASSLADLDKNTKGTKIEKAKLVGKLIAERALNTGIKNAIFDRNGYLYHGRIKSLAEAAREQGIKF